MTQPCDFLRSSVTHPRNSPVIYTNLGVQERLKDLGRQLKFHREDLASKKNAIRYIFDHHDSNLSGTSVGDASETSNLDIKIDRILTAVDTTQGKINNIEAEVGNLSVNFDRLSTRMQNTEHHLGLNPSAEVMPVPTIRPRRIDRTYEQLQLQQQQHQQQQGPSALASVNTTPSVTGASALAVGDKQNEAEVSEKPPRCTTKGALMVSRCLPHTWRI